MAIAQASDIQLILGARIRGLQNAVNSDEAISLAQAQALVNKNAFKDDVRVRAPGNINLATPGAAVDGVTMANGDRFLAPLQTVGTEIGIYIWNGSAVAATRAPDAASFDDMESAVVMVSEGTSAGTRWRQTAVNGVIGTNALAFISDQTAVPAATESTAGILQVATQAETDAGSIDNKIITPLKLATAKQAHKFTKTVIGDGVATSYSVPHSFATTDVDAVVRENTGARRQVIVENGTPDANTVQIIFAGAPPSNSYAVFITKKA
jgi:hypothetical protein